MADRTQRQALIDRIRTSSAKVLARAEEAERNFKEAEESLRAIGAPLATSVLHKEIPREHLGWGRVNGKWCIYLARENGTRDGWSTLPIPELLNAADRLDELLGAIATRAEMFAGSE